jgi:hypothetical protein
MNTIKKFYVLPTKCIMLFCMDLRTESFALQKINWLLFITEAVCVYCAVGSGSLNKTGLHFVLKVLKSF